MGVCTCSLNIYSPPGKWRCDSLNLYPVVELGVSKYGGVSQPFVPHTQKVIKHPPAFGMDHHAVSGPSGQNGPCQGWAARGSRHGDTRNAWEAMSQNWSLTLKRRTCKHQQYPLVLKHVLLQIPSYLHLVRYFPMEMPIVLSDFPATFDSPSFQFLWAWTSAPKIYGYHINRFIWVN